MNRSTIAWPWFSQTVRSKGIDWILTKKQLCIIGNQQSVCCGFDMCWLYQQFYITISNNQCNFNIKLKYVEVYNIQANSERKGQWRLWCRSGCTQRCTSELCFQAQPALTCRFLKSKDALWFSCWEYLLGKESVNFKNKAMQNLPLWQRIILNFQSRLESSPRSVNQSPSMWRKACQALSNNAMIFKDSVSMRVHRASLVAKWIKLVERRCAANLHQAGSVLRELRVQDLSASDIVPAELFFKDSRSAQILGQLELCFAVTFFLSCFFDYGK